MSHLFSLFDQALFVKIETIMAALAAVFYIFRESPTCFSSD